jgi:8-oxo-dGTP pyrophosphatase MutT (NUDIX family)
MGKLRQIAAIPVRRSEASGVEVLLVTSRETQRWVIPKGWPWRKRDDRDAAAGEAWEEAGVRGSVERKVVGTFTYDKRRGEKAFKVKVDVYLLEVAEEASKWPEAHERRREWYSAEEAARLVQEPGLQAILLALAQKVSA